MTRTQKLGLCTWLPEDPVCLAEVNDNFNRLDNSGARALRHLLQEQVENPLSDLILSQPETKKIVVSVENGEVMLHGCTPLLAAE